MATMHSARSPSTPADTAQFNDDGPRRRSFRKRTATKKFVSMLRKSARTKTKWDIGDHALVNTGNKTTFLPATIVGIETVAPVSGRTLPRRASSSKYKRSRVPPKFQIEYVLVPNRRAWVAPQSLHRLLPCPVCRRTNCSSERRILPGMTLPACLPCAETLQSRSNNKCRWQPKPKRSKLVMKLSNRKPHPRKRKAQKHVIKPEVLDNNCHISPQASESADASTPTKRPRSRARSVAPHTPEKRRRSQRLIQQQQPPANTWSGANNIAPLVADGSDASVGEEALVNSTTTERLQTCCLSRLPCDIDMFDHDNFLLESGISLFDASSASCVERSRAMTGLTYILPSESTHLPPIGIRPLLSRRLLREFSESNETTSAMTHRHVPLRYLNFYSKKHRPRKATSKTTKECLTILKNLREVRSCCVLNTIAVADINKFILHPDQRQALLTATRGSMLGHQMPAGLQNELPFLLQTGKFVYVPLYMGATAKSIGELVMLDAHHRTKSKKSRVKDLKRSNIGVGIRCRKAKATGRWAAMGYDHVIFLEVEIYVEHTLWKSAPLALKDSLHQLAKMLEPQFVALNYIWQRKVQAAARQGTTPHAARWLKLPPFRLTWVRQYYCHELVSVGRNCSLPKEAKAFSPAAAVCDLDRLFSKQELPRNTRNSEEARANTQPSNDDQLPTPRIHEFFLDLPEDELPLKYSVDRSTAKNTSRKLHRFGVTTYTNVFSEAELCELERHVLQLDRTRFHGGLMTNTAHSTYLCGQAPHTNQLEVAQPTPQPDETRAADVKFNSSSDVSWKCTVGSEVRSKTSATRCLDEDTASRTKYFFGARYLWTANHKANSQYHLANGIRMDVNTIPNFIVRDVVPRYSLLPRCWPQNDQKPQKGTRAQKKRNDKSGGDSESPLASNDFINSAAINIYHDGREGLAQHFDDASRFCRPVISLRLFSDCRLTFGGSGFTASNAACVIPMPRGCVTVLEPSSYAADAIKHCVRACDMTKRSAVLIVRRIHPELLQQASKLYLNETTEQLAAMDLNAAGKDWKYTRYHETEVVDSQSGKGCSSRKRARLEATANLKAVKSTLKSLISKVVQAEKARVLSNRERKQERSMEKKLVRQVVKSLVSTVVAKERAIAKEAREARVVQCCVRKMVRVVQGRVSRNRRDALAVRSALRHMIDTVSSNLPSPGAVHAISSSVQ